MAFAATHSPYIKLLSISQILTGHLIRIKLFLCVCVFIHMYVCDWWGLVLNVVITTVCVMLISNIYIYIYIYIYIWDTHTQFFHYVTIITLLSENNLTVYPIVFNSKGVHGKRSKYLYLSINNAVSLPSNSCKQDMPK